MLHTYSYQADGGWCPMLNHIFLNLKQSGIFVHPWKLTCRLKSDYCSREYIFQPLIFKGHVSFQGSNFSEVVSWFGWDFMPTLIPPLSTKPQATQPFLSQLLTFLGPFLGWWNSAHWAFNKKATHNLIKPVSTKTQPLIFGMLVGGWLVWKGR